MPQRHATALAAHALAPAPAGVARTRRIAIGFFVLVALTYGLIVLGALVRAHGAGLACPDWPLCFGEWIPKFDLKVAFEWSHRLVAGSVSLLFVGLAATTLRERPLRSALSHLVAFAAAVLAVQIVLGALTVWQLLAAWTVTSHLLVGNTFAVALLFTACALIERVQPVERATVSPAVGALVLVTTTLLVVQIALGGLVSSSFAGLACDEWPTCSEGLWFPDFAGARGLHLVHRLTGYALAVALIACAFATRGQARRGPLAATTAALALAQIAVGVTSVLQRIPVELTALHSALAGALVLATALLARETWLARAPVLQQRPDAPRAS